MKASKYTLWICWTMFVLSLLTICILRLEADIQVQEAITKSKWTYDYDTRNFYIGLWGNILTGIIVALATTYVSYGQAKHQLEFALMTSEQGMCVAFQSIMCGVYTADKVHIHNNVCRFKHEHSNLSKHYKNMIIAHNDYSPFIKTKKARAFFDGKKELQGIWIDLATYNDDLLIQIDEDSIQEIIKQIQGTLLRSKGIVDNRNLVLRSLLT